MINIINKISKIISSAIFVVLVFIICLILAYVLRIKYLEGQNRLDEVKINFYTILTQSMYPSIKAGDIVITYKNNDNIYNVGDVITFVSDANGGITITHRIKDAFSLNGKYSYKTKGDNNNAVDRELVDSDNVLGKVVVKIPKAGYIQQFLVTKTGWIVAIVLPSLGIIIYDILKLFRVTARKGSEVVKRNKRTDDARVKLKEVIDDESEE